jgi:hypothetical protein
MSRIKEVTSELEESRRQLAELKTIDGLMDLMIRSTTIYREALQEIMNLPGEKSFDASNIASWALQEAGKCTK